MSVSRKDKKITIVMPAYNAAKTLEKTYLEIPDGSYDEIILVDDASKDNTVELAKKLNLIIVEHQDNKGYGANQKSCYKKALERGADVIVMLHPDFQYDPRIIPNIALPIIEGQADIVLASRMIRDPMLGGPIKGGMPVYKFIANRLLTFFENLALGTYFSEFHTGYRAFSREALESIPFDLNSDDFVFDNEIIVQGIIKKLRFKEIPVITKYFKDASSVNFIRSVRYGAQVIWTTLKYLMHKYKIKSFKQFDINRI
ncbi:glycosyltransferase family 2 protein [Candidatus Omnitrophota bacterium]